MTKPTFYNLFFALFLMLSTITIVGAYAQITYPIYVMPSLTPPYSLTLSDYSQIGSQRLVVTINVRDVTVTNLPVRLNLKMETTNGVTIETIPNIAVAPIFLTGGEVSVLFGDDMRDYFNINNLQFKGYSKEEYRRTGQLPEGFYRFTVEVRHFNTGRLISNQGTAIAWIALGKPPVLKTPDNGAEMGQITGMPMTFSWIPSSVGIPNVVTQYTFEMWEMRVPGIPPAVVAASMPVFYSTTQMNTVLSIIPTTLMLEPGMNYAWRVTASDAMGQVHFAQDGRSEVRTFVYQCRCDSVTNFRVERLGQDVTYRWTPDKNHSSFNIEIENPVNKWSKSERVFDAKYLFKSDPDKTYRMRVQAICKGNETNPSDFTAWQTVVIPAIKTQEEICPDCECGKEFPDRPLTNFTLRTDLQPGDTVETQNGGTRLILKTVNKQSENTYNGLIWFWWEYYGVKILCKYWDLQVNTDNWILPGYGLVSVYDPKFLLNVDSVKSYLNQLGDAAATLTTNKTIRDTVQVNVPLEGAYMQNGKLIVQNPDGTESVYPLNNPNRTLIKGSDGEEYVLTSDGKMVGKEEFAATGGNSRLMDNYNKEKEDKAQPSVDFSASPNQIYGFDAYTEIKGAIQNEYPELLPGSGYRPSFKSLASFKLDKVLANGNDNITYRTEMGISAMKTGGTLTVRGGSDGDETILYAYSKKDTTETVVGKLNLLSFDEKTKKVYLVSVNGASLPPNITTLQTELDRIYAPAVMKWNVTEKPGIQVTFPGGNMTHGGSGALSVYNSDQKNVIKAYGQMEKDAYYLFFVNNVQGKAGVNGYMPLQYQSGFIYDSRDAVDVAHELAHGAFSLYHTFSSDRFIAAQNATDNLMDYSGGVELWKHQWKEIQNPSNSWFKFLQDEEEGEKTGDVLRIINALREAIKNDTYAKIYLQATQTVKNYGIKINDYTLKNIEIQPYSYSVDSTKIKTIDKSTWQKNGSSNTWYTIRINGNLIIYLDTEEDRDKLYEYINAAPTYNINDIKTAATDATADADDFQCGSCCNICVRSAIWRIAESSILFPTTGSWLGAANNSDYLYGKAEGFPNATSASEGQANSICLSLENGYMAEFEQISNMADTTIPDFAEIQKMANRGIIIIGTLLNDSGSGHVVMVTPYKDDLSMESENYDYRDILVTGKGTEVLMPKILECGQGRKLTSATLQEGVNKNKIKDMKWYKMIRIYTSENNKLYNP